jgi:uncharacterized membrane protein/rubredoxin
MKEYVKCKSCGYIMEAAKLGDKCPACGVPAKMFEPYDDKVSEKRRKLIDLHIHPVIVHFPQAFASLLLVVGIVLFFAIGSFRTLLLDTATVLGILLPFSVAAAFVAGLFDAKTRFRKLTSPILRRKMLLGVIFFVASCGTALLVGLAGLESGAALVGFTMLCAVGLGCGLGLGLLGAPLFIAKFPG